MADHPCRCPQGHGQMVPIWGRIAPGGPLGEVWVCPVCGVERLWPDDVTTLAERDAYLRAQSRAQRP